MQRRGKFCIPLVTQKQYNGDQMRKALIFAGIGVLSWVSLGQISSKVESFLDMKSGIEKFESTADKFEVNQKTGWITLTGNVKVITDKQEMTSEVAKVHRESGVVQASGHVVITQPGMGEWRGDSVEYNYKTGKGLAVNGFLKSANFRVYAGQMERTAEGLYLADDVSVTTCTNEFHHLHFRLAGDARLKDGDYAEVYNAVPYLFGIPLFYVPYWYRALDVDYGIRVHPGYTSRWGGYVLLSYKLNIYRSEQKEGPKLDATSHLEFRSKRGVGVGETLEWDLKRWGEGEFSAFHFWDSDPNDENGGKNWSSTIPSERYKLELVHATDITPRDLFLVRGKYLSDSEVLDDYFESSNRDESIPINFASYEHREHALAAGVLASGPLNEFYGGVARLPEGWLDIMPTPVLNTGINYESQTRVGYLERQAAYYDKADDPMYAYYPGDWADYETVRGNTAHRVTYPMKFYDLLSVVPRAGYQGTYYQDSASGDSLYRHAGELGAEASMRFVSGWENGWRHTIEPYIDYSWQPVDWSDNIKNEAGENQVYMFDRVDRSLEWLDQFGMDGVWLPYDWHGVRPGLRNLFQTKSETTGAPRTVLDVDLFAAIQIDDFSSRDAEPNIADEGVRMVGMKTVFSPIESFQSRAVAEWDTEEDRLAYIDLNAHYKLTSRFSVGGGYMGRDHEMYDYASSPVEQWNRAEYSVLYTGFFHEITDAWAWSMFVRYDTDEGSLDEVGGFIQYSLDCLVFQLRSGYRTSYTRIDGSEKDSDFRVSFIMWFRAMSPAQRNAWDRW
jgi:lipopolysaccharide assembly outer membrane protein LptD (OstA)